VREETFYWIASFADDLKPDDEAIAWNWWQKIWQRACGKISLRTAKTLSFPFFAIQSCGLSEASVNAVVKAIENASAPRVVKQSVRFLMFIIYRCNRWYYCGFLAPFKREAATILFPKKVGGMKPSVFEKDRYENIEVAGGGKIGRKTRGFALISNPTGRYD
jgi:hypothetical protein